MAGGRAGVRVTARERLPNRRPQITESVAHDGLDHQVSIGHYRDGRPGEVFIEADVRAGTYLHALHDDVGIALSLLLQYGCAPGELAGRLGRTADGARTSVLGRVADLLAGAEVREQMTDDR